MPTPPRLRAMWSQALRGPERDLEDLSHNLCSQRSVTCRRGHQAHSFSPASRMGAHTRPPSLPATVGLFNTEETQGRGFLRTRQLKSSHFQAFSEPKCPTVLAFAQLIPWTTFWGLERPFFVPTIPSLRVGSCGQGGHWTVVQCSPRGGRSPRESWSSQAAPTRPSGPTGLGALLTWDLSWSLRPQRGGRTAQRGHWL